MTTPTAIIPHYKKTQKRCTCPASKTATGMAINWRKTKIVSEGRAWCVCLACKAEWTSDAKYIDGMSWA